MKHKLRSRLQNQSREITRSKERVLNAFPIGHSFKAILILCLIIAAQQAFPDCPRLINNCDLASNGYPGSCTYYDNFTASGGCLYENFGCGQLTNGVCAATGSGSAWLGAGPRFDYYYSLPTSPSTPPGPVADPNNPPSSFDLNIGQQRPVIPTYPRGIPFHYAPAAVTGVRGLVERFLSLSNSAEFFAPGISLFEDVSTPIAAYEVTFPIINEAYVAFGFDFEDMGDGDWLQVSFNGTEIWQRSGTDFAPNHFYTGLLPGSSLSDQSGVLQFTLISSGQRNARVFIFDTGRVTPSAGSARGHSILSTIAGTQPTNVAALDAGIGQPAGLAIDATGNLYLSSGYLQGVFKIDTNGLLTHQAGNGVPAYSGEEDPAVVESLSNPSGIALDPVSGTLFIAETDNNMVRSLNLSTGMLSLIAGSGALGFSGDGGSATKASLNRPSGLALDHQGNLLIADEQNNRIRSVNLGTGIISTFAGTGVAGYSGENLDAASTMFSSPRAIAVTSSGDVLVADYGNNRIRKINFSDSLVTTVAGTGTAGFDGDQGRATDALIDGPSGVAEGPDQSVYVTDQNNNRIRRIVNGDIDTIAGNGSPGFSGDGDSAVNASLDLPKGILASEDGKIYFCDSGNHRIRLIAGGDISTVGGNGTLAFSGDGGNATEASISAAISSVVLDPQGDIVFADTDNHRIRKIDNQTGAISTLAGNGDSGFSGDECLATETALNRPEGISFDSSGDLYIADTGNERIRRVNHQTGFITTLAGNGTAGFSGDGGLPADAMLDDPSQIFLKGDVLYFVDRGNNRIRTIDGNTISTVAGGGSSIDEGIPAVSADLLTPGGLVVDPQNNIFLTTAYWGLVRRIDGQTGTINTIAGSKRSASFNWDGQPASEAYLSHRLNLAQDGFSNFYIADRDNDRIRFVDSTGMWMHTIAGNGNRGFSSNGASSESLHLALPTSVLPANDGSLFIGDSGARRIVQASPLIARLSVSLTPASSTLQSGQLQEFTVTIQNQGPQAASEILVTAEFSSSATVLSASPLQGTCYAGQSLSCDLGGLSSGAESAITFWIQSTEVGTLDVSLSAESIEFDDSLENNFATASVETISPVIGEAGQLMVRKNSTDPGLLDFSWNQSCGVNTTNYEVYEGSIGDFYSHQPLPSYCGVASTSVSGVEPNSGSEYYLVVPASASEEGSYGLSSSGTERPPATTPCLMNQAIEKCP